jgi:hypothetical protein
MRLSDAQAGRFFSVYWPLLQWTNEKCGIVPELRRDAAGALCKEDALKIREVLWKDDTLRARFVAENPAGLAPDLRAIVDSWRHRRVGTFYVWKHRRKHTIFIDGDDVLAVLGLYSSFAEILPASPPLLVDAVLLPFEGAIVHDGIVCSYNVSLGAQMRRDAREIYRNAVHSGKVREHFDTASPASRVVRRTA